jgi:hypothetical protein
VYDILSSILVCHLRAYAIKHYRTARYAILRDSRRFGGLCPINALPKQCAHL